MCYKVPAVVPPGPCLLSLFGARHRALDPDDIALAGLLVAFGGAIMRNVSAHADSQRTALQLRDAADSRMVVDQAKGILMHSLGCTAQEAFDKMRAISQARNVKVAGNASLRRGPAQAGIPLRPGPVSWAAGTSGQSLKRSCRTAAAGLRRTRAAEACPTGRSGSVSSGAAAARAAAARSACSASSGSCDAMIAGSEPR
jgi:hypothetical protein